MEHPPEPTAARWATLPTWLLTQTGNHAHRLVSEGFAAVDARGYHYRLLATLDEFGPASQATLGRRSGIHVSDMVATINELADHTLVERTPDPTDRRRNIISLTTAGKRRLRRLEKQLAHSQEELLDPLSPGERRQLTGLLAKLLDHHNRKTDTTEPSHQRSDHVGAQTERRDTPH
ncbi:MarR family winged helix-turn-helix transcriptional regulator [Nocardia sp. FBN12]|uniref:MarR family winged helix-turn-helix transcriptional regulator n=1 Tax=Nocardia sp. FBN12 TaxID=3419766 RepID=UPI003D07B17A